MRAIVLLVLTAGCGGGPRNGQTGDAIVDACLHWTACVTPPPLAIPPVFSDCATFSMGRSLPWRSVSVTLTPASLACIAGAGLDCAAALDCVSTPSATACDTPMFACDGDTLTMCDAIAGPRVVGEDCAAAGLHCVLLGSEARCGLGSCDPKSFTTACAGSLVTGCQSQTSLDDKSLGGLVVVDDDCSLHDATCSGGQCVGNGPACTPSPDTLGCDGDDIVFCDESGHQERNHCADQGLTCVENTTGPGFSYVCARPSGLVGCQEDQNFRACDGNSLQYCDEHGNQRLDCVALGYSGCDSGRCVP